VVGTTIWIYLLYLRELYSNRYKDGELNYNTISDTFDFSIYKATQDPFHIFPVDFETYRIEIRAKRIGFNKPVNVYVVKTDVLGSENSVLIRSFAPITNWENFNSEIPYLQETIFTY